MFHCHYRKVFTALAITFSFLFLNISSFTGAAYAQNSNATIRGQVLDSTGAVIPSAKVLIVNEQTGVKVFDGPTDSAGTFVAPQVLAGMYRVTVTAPGMKGAILNDVVATVAQVTALDVKMELGAATETVTVTSHDQELDRSTSVISTLIAPQEVANIPLNLRAPENLLTFVPGVAYGNSLPERFPSPPPTRLKSPVTVPPAASTVPTTCVSKVICAPSSAIAVAVVNSFVLLAGWKNCASFRL